MSSILIKGLVRGKTAIKVFWETNRFLDSFLEMSTQMAAQIEIDWAFAATIF
jgi:hypothetical protein